MAEVPNESSDIQKSLLPGAVVDTAYTSGSNLTKAKSDLVGNNRFRQEFTSLGLGAAGIQFLIPNRSLLADSFIHMELNQIPEDCYLPRGWGLIAVNRIDMAVGGSQTLTLTREAIWQTIFRECETEEKRNAVMKMMGGEVTGPHLESEPRLHAIVPLTVFFSTIRYLGRHVPYDSSLVNAPIRIAIYLSPPEEIYMGANAALAPRALSRGYVQIRQLDFKQQDDSMRQLLISNPSVKYTYPFFYPQNFTSPPFRGSTEAASPCTVNLTGFRRGNLQSIVLQIQPTDFTSRTDPTAIKNVLTNYKPENIQLVFNGQIVFEEVKDNDAWALCHSLAAAEVPTLAVDPLNVLTAPYTEIPVKSNFTEILLSQFNEVSFSNLVQSGASYENQVLTVQFTTPDDANTEYRLYASYNYQASVVTQGQNASFVF